MRRGRGRAGPRTRLPGGPPRPGGRGPGPRVREPDLPALGPLRHQRRLHRDLRRRGRRRRPGRGRPSARPSPAFGAGAHPRRGERVLPGHDPPHGIPPPQPGSADHPRPRAGAVRAETRGQGGGGIPGRERPRAHGRDALDPPSRRAPHHRGHERAARAGPRGPRAHGEGPERAREHELGHRALRPRRDDPRRRPALRREGVLGAFGPGFGAEPALLEFC